MRPVFLVIFLFSLSFSGFAQIPSARISGLLKDTQNEPLPGATVRLLRATDSTLVRGELTKNNGTFTFTDLTADTYRIHVTSVGNTDYRSGNILIDELHTTVTLPVFIITPSKTTLNEVKVVAKKPLIEQEVDRTIVNVEAMIGSAGSNTLEMLEKTPGVTIGTNGEISLNGKANVLVLVDGRPTYMSGQDLATYLKSLPGGSLDKLELMTNPPAKYDAAGNSIINIRLKRNRIQGFTGNVALGYNQGRIGRSNNVINLNYNHKKINLFGSLGYSKDGNYATDVYDRRFYTSNSLVASSVQLTNQYNTTSHGIMSRLGMDYAASPNTTYGFVVNLQHSPRRDRLNYVSRSLDNRYVIDSIGTGFTNGTYRWTNVGVNGNVQHSFGKTGREFSADLNYITYGSEGEQSLQNSVNRPDGTLLNNRIFLYKLPYSITIYSAKADYSHPLPNKAKLEMGAKSSIVTNDNNAQYFNQNGTSLSPDYGKSNHFIYRESIHAAYLNFRKDWRRLAVQSGFRLENTQIAGRQLGNTEVAETSFFRNYAGLFPTAFVSYKLDSAGANTLTASFSRRISRPNYQLLNPFLAYRDQYSFTMGNPYLKPQYNNQIELKYQHKHYVGISLQYSRFTDIIFQLTETIDDIFITRPNNVASGNILALSTNVSVAPAKWWNVNANVMLAHLKLNGTAYAQKLDPEIYHARINLLNQFRLNKGWNGELSGYYSSNDLSGQTITSARYRIAAAVQKKIWQDKGSIRLTLEDIFHSWKTTDRTVSLKQIEAFHTNVTDTQRIGLTFTYRFGKETFARKRNHSDNAADAEKNRVD
ncbi:outer membrane beta-barrel protein [Spirosoma sp. BT702]|uniref:Outer membrane beta-barrel protein n=1 Tax=Spirosoma profusum TaxID=2771354 RepID=A0A927AQF9_9BACT|nr:TonB-dependent receptor [Spirosoma profusum]MBD2700378.1 outer membrane beta-barrel protein [Spirosoma profusum]